MQSSQLIDESTRRWPLVPASSWVSRALCGSIEPDQQMLFFSTSWRGVQQAKAICARCEATTSCLDYALTDVRLQGVWGGTSHRERKRNIWHGVTIGGSTG